MDPVPGYFAVHGQGLGHASRAIALVRGLQEKAPELEFLFLAGSPALDLLVASGFDVMPLPPVPDWPAERGRLRPAWRWYVEYARYLRVARRFLRKDADWSHYRFLISEGELASVLEARRRGTPAALIVNSVRRDFARDGVSRLAERAANAWTARRLRKVDLLLTFEPAPAWPNARRTDPAVRPFSRSRDQLRDDFFFRKKTILVTAGGTAIGEFLLDAAVRAFRELDLADASMVLVSGPKLKASPAPGVYTYGFIPNLHDMVLAADLVITTAGRGTVSEALAAGTPLIAIPPQGHAEQEATARSLGFRHEDVGRMKELILEGLAVERGEPRSSQGGTAIGMLLDFVRAEGKI